MARTTAVQFTWATVREWLNELERCCPYIVNGRLESRPLIQEVDPKGEWRQFKHNGMMEFTLELTVTTPPEPPKADAVAAFDDYYFEWPADDDEEAVCPSRS